MYNYVISQPMKILSRSIYILSCAALLSILQVNSALAQLNVTDNQTAQSLAQKLTGAGVTVLNATMHCQTQANGVFTTISSNLGLDSGIVLTNGVAETTPYQNGVNGASGVFASNNNGDPGDPQLTSLAGQSTHDACSLEFDVIPGGDTISFDYVFGSEEYISATCGPYNDAFAFFISGPGITGSQNMALVPGTNIPVTINSINSGVPGPGHNISGCTIMGPGSPFTQYYINNSQGTTITYQGITTVLKATHIVTPCGTYHLKLVIADAGNATYDSGVFIKAGSLQSATLKARIVNNTNTPVAAIVKNCAPATLRVRRPEKKTTPQTVKLVLGGTAINGVDYAFIADSVIIPANDTVGLVTVQGLATALNGPKTLKVFVKTLFNCSYPYDDSASVTIYDTIHAAILTPDTSVCIGDQVAIRVSGDNALSYSWTPAATLTSANAKEPTAKPSANTTYQLSINYPGMGCAAKNYLLKVKVLPVPTVSISAPDSLCLGAVLSLAANVSPAYNGYSYTWTGPNAFSSSSAQPVINTVQATASGVYTVKVKVDTSGCFATANKNFEVIVTEKPTFDNPISMCYNKPPIELLPGLNVKWYDESVQPLPGAPVISTAALANYKYFVTQTSNGCESAPAEVDVAVKVCCDGNVFIPDAFTPNGDGHNDVLKVGMSFGYSLEWFRIFNRWGQLLFESSDASHGWDGRQNGEVPELGNYFYTVRVNCVNGGVVERKGIVSLIR